jgi:hypothetical protein
VVEDASPATQEMIAEELKCARDMITRVVGTLAVRDWGLFDG